MAIEKGNKVKVDYEGRFDDGEVFDSSSHGDHSHPLEFVAGSGQVIKGFDEAVIGMEKDEEKEISINPEEGYGMPNPSLIQKVPKDMFPGQEPKEGMIFQGSMPDGRHFMAKITKVENDEVTVDLNHPLAGRKLIFKIKIVEYN
jgi:FKBP-type peptidyl-prolyl cis-trans isomerase 2